MSSIVSPNICQLTSLASYETACIDKEMAFQWPIRSFGERCDQAQSGGPCQVAADIVGCGVETNVISGEVEKQEDDTCDISVIVGDRTVLTVVSRAHAVQFEHPHARRPTQVKSVEHVGSLATQRKEQAATQRKRQCLWVEKASYQSDSLLPSDNRQPTTKGQLVRIAHTHTSSTDGPRDLSLSFRLEVIRITSQTSILLEGTREANGADASQSGVCVAGATISW